MKSYIRKIFNHDTTHEVSVKTDIVLNFFDDSKSFDIKGTKSQKTFKITINNATDPRFGGEFKNLLDAEGGINVNDLFVIYKPDKGEYILEIISQTDSRYNTWFTLFNKNERHNIVLNDDEINESKNQDDDFNVFGLHIPFDNNALSEDNPHICIGWSSLGDLNKYSSKDDLKERYITFFKNCSDNKIGADVSQIWMFKKETKINDYIVYFDKNIAHIGKITSEYYFNNSLENQNIEDKNNKKVHWIKEININDIPSEYLKSSTIRKTIFRLNSYKELIIQILKGNEIVKDEYDDYEDKEIIIQNPTYDYLKSNINDGKNLIVYGTPGCGKSYYVEHELLKDFSQENNIRTTFFQDYSNTDFIGQILPFVNGDKVTYEFNPGPFTLALEKALNKPNEKVALVIEELNRGCAASIFGDIFQLLDRKKGLSEYSIINVNIINYLNKRFKNKYQFKEIRIPSNMFIYATMNTSDQNVFTLDTAFKRRWKFLKLSNEFKNNHVFKDYYVPGADITWKDMVESINEYILADPNNLNGEDKQIGVYFVDKDGMRKNSSDPNDEKYTKEFAFKLFEYLWSDVTKFDHSTWFGEIKSLDDLIKSYQQNGLKVFKDVIFKKQ